MLILVSGPSGVGKSTIINELLKRHENLKVMTTYTTRAAREKVDGAYYHVSKEEFEKMIKENKLFEYENVHADIFYGTPFASLEKVAEGEFDYIKDMDVNGTKKIKEYLNGKARVVSIFLDSPDHKLRQRLQGRGESAEMIEKRLSRVEMERSHKKNYDFVVECDDICETTNQVENFIGKDTFK